MKSHSTYTYQYPMPAVTVDIVVLHRTCISDSPKVLLVRRKDEPHAGKLALPGGFLNPDETCAEAAVRELREETGLSIFTPSFIGYRDRPDRDPRQRVITMAFGFSAVGGDPPAVVGMDDAADALWLRTDDPQSFDLAFDHEGILREALVKMWFVNEADERDELIRLVCGGAS